MRYMVHFVVTPEAGTKIESAPGGPGPLIGRVVERFKPEQMYLSPARREGWMVARINDETEMAELMITLSGFAGSYPEFTPITTLQEFPGVVSKAIPNAMKLIKG